MPDATPPPFTPSSDKLTWIHSDPRTLPVAIEAGLSRAQTGPWTDDAAAQADFRGLLLGACFMLAELGPTRPGLVNGSVSLTIASATRADDLDWQTALGRAVGALALKQQAPIPTGSVTYTTKAGDPGVEPLATGQWWAYAIAATAVVACTGILAHYLAQIVSQENEIKAVKLATDGNQAQLASALATATQTLQAHKDAEEKAGASLPYDQKENQLLDTLNAAIEKSAGWKAPPLKSIPDPDIIPKGIAGATDKIGDAALVLAALVGASFLLK